jgi:tellurite resistance protein TehA-like permease
LSERRSPQGEGSPTSPLADLAGLSPAYFGLVMATGIVSIAAHQLGLPRVGMWLFRLNLVAYAVLWTLTLLRAALHTRHFAADMIDHLRGPGFFTVVAASGVLGSQFAVLEAGYGAAVAMWIVTIVLWVVLTYTIFTALVVKEHKPPLDRGIGGGWLLAIVATQAIAVLSALVAGHVETEHKIELNFLALSMWLWGGMLYIWMMALIFYRYLFFRLSPSDLAPPYWINMGAMAISTLAGALFIDNAPDAPFLRSLMPFIKGFTVLYWATATWWIPMLLVLGVWRHVYRRFPLTYDPLYWGAVFPLGMYATATDAMAHALGFRFLAFLPPLMLWVAIAAWLLAFLGMVVDLGRRMRSYAGSGSEQ